MGCGMESYNNNNNSQSNEDKPRASFSLIVPASASFSSLSSIETNNESKHVRRSHTLGELYPHNSSLVVKTDESFLEVDKHLDITNNINPSNTGTIIGQMRFNRDYPYPASLNITSTGKCFVPTKELPITDKKVYAIVEKNPGVLSTHIDATGHFYLTLDRKSLKKLIVEYGLFQMLPNYDSLQQEKFLKELKETPDFKSLNTVVAQDIEDSIQKIMRSKEEVFNPQTIEDIIEALPNLFKLFKLSLDDIKKLDYKNLKTFPVFAAGEIYFDSQGAVIEITPLSGYAHTSKTDDKGAQHVVNESQRRARESFDFFKRHKNLFVNYEQATLIDNKIKEASEDARAHHAPFTPQMEQELRKKLTKYMVNITLFNSLVNSLSVPNKRTLKGTYSSEEVNKCEREDIKNARRGSVDSNNLNRNSNTDIRNNDVNKSLSKSRSSQN